MPGPIIKQTQREAPPVGEEETREYLRRESHPLLGQTRRAVNSSVRLLTSDYSVTPDDEVLVVDASGGAVTVTPPFAANYFRRLIVKKADSSANAVTVSPQSGETIEGATSVVLTSQWAGIDITPSGRDGEWITGATTTTAVQRPVVFNVSGTALTLQQAWIFNYVRTTSGTAVTLTVDDDDSVFVNGDWVKLFQDGAGALTVAAGSGVTLNYPETLVFYKQKSTGFIQKSASKTWDVDIDAVLA